MSEDCMTSVLRDANNDWFEVTFNDGYVGRYPYVWLRDNCRCPECYHPSSYQRSMLMANLDLDIQPEEEELVDDGKVLKVVWPNGHTSPYPAKWLKLHRFDKTDYDPIKHITTVSWGSEFVDQIPSYNYNDLMSDNKTLYQWLVSLMRYGLVLIKGAPQEVGIIEKICRKVAYPRMTGYGTSFRVESLFDSSSLAYTTAELGLHVDLPFYDYRPCTQLLHCIRQCEVKGGESQFVDAKRVAEQLKREEPELFDIMTKVKIDFRLCGKDYVDYHLQQARTIIELDENGEFKTLACNDGVRAPYLNVPVEKVAKVYKAMKKFHQALYRKDNFINFKLNAGEVVAFDNNRVMHGRSAYTVNVAEGEEKSRLLQGGYLDWDEIHSRVRLIDEEINGTPRL